MDTDEYSTVLTSVEDVKEQDINDIPFEEWTLVEIENWLSNLNFGFDLIRKFTENNITGEVLPYLNDGDFNEMGIALKDKIRLKIEINKLCFKTFNNDDKLFKIILNLNDLIKSNVETNYTVIFNEFNKFKDEMIKSNTKPLPTPEKSTSSPFNLSSPTKKQSPKESKRNSMVDLKRNSYLPQPVSEPLKQLRASTDDPCSKILQAAMKRHKLNDDWRNYVLVICYGDNERILRLDEKPVLIFKELKEKGEHPAIMLRQKAEGITTNTPGGKL